jgi:hypothetical protein
MRQSETIGKLALALSKAQGKLSGAAKSSDNPFFKSKYADLHECIEAAKDALTANELAVVQTTDTEQGVGIWVYTTLVHSSGEWVQGKILMNPKKDDDQSTGSSITYGRRYGYAAIVGLAQKDDDGNASVQVEKPAVKPATKAAFTTWAETERGKDLSWFTSSVKNECKSLDELTAWWQDNQPEIKKLSVKDQTAIKTICGDMKKRFTMEMTTDVDPQIKVIICPETDEEVFHPETCIGKPCNQGCPEYADE